MGIAKIYNQKQSGININGLIEDYYAYAGENISAGDFVEFVNGVAGQTTETSVDTAIKDTGASTAYYISAVALDDTRVFIAHTIYENSIYVLYGVVCIINGASIIVGTDTLINDRRNCQYPISTMLLQDGRVFVTHTGSNTANGSGYSFLWGVLCEVSNNVISVNQKQILVNDTVYSNSSKVLPNGSVFIAHRYGTSNYIYGMIVEISGTTITTKTDTQLYGGSNQSATELSTVLLDKESVFIINGYSSNYRLYGMICTINGTTLTAGTNTSLISTNYSGRALSSDKIDTNKVFISHEYGDGLYGIVCSVSDTTITKGTDTQIFNYVSTVSSTLTLATNRVLIVGINNTTDYKLFGVICDIDNNTITKNTPTIMNPNSYTGSRTSPVLLRNNVFIAHSYNSVDKLYAQMFGIDKINNIPTNTVTIKEYETQVRKATTSDIYGVAKTSGMGAYKTFEYTLAEGESVSKGEERDFDVLETLISGDIIPKTWTDLSGSNINKEYVAEDGTKIFSWGGVPSNAFDGDTGSYWRGFATASKDNHIGIIFTEPKKITKLKTHIKEAYGTPCLIQGSKDGIEWVTLKSFGSTQTSLVEITLDNPDFYSQYKICFPREVSALPEVYEVQVSEYIGFAPTKGIALQSGTAGDTIQIAVPITDEESTGHKDIVSIYTI